MKKLNFKRLFLVIYCIAFIIFFIFYLTNVFKLHNLKKSNISINNRYLNLNSKSIKNIALKTSRVTNTTLARIKKLQSYVEFGGLELPIEDSTGYASVKMNLMSEPNYNSGIVTTFAARNWI